MTLGVTNGTNNYGLQSGGVSGVTGSGYLVTASQNRYGTNNGSQSSNSNLNNSTTIGVTTDPAQSGIVLETDEIAKTFIAY